MVSNKVIIYTDGACSGNPGPGGWGALLSINKLDFETSGFSANTTNNRRELTAVIESLNFFRWSQVILIVIVFAIITLVGETISERCASYWLKTSTRCLM